MVHGTTVLTLAPSQGWTWFEGPKGTIYFLCAECLGIQGTPLPCTITQTAPETSVSATLQSIGSLLWTLFYVASMISQSVLNLSAFFCVCVRWGKRCSNRKGGLHDHLAESEITAEPEGRWKVSTWHRTRARRGVQRKAAALGRGPRSSRCHRTRYLTKRESEWMLEKVWESKPNWPMANWNFYHIFLS